MRSRACSFASRRLTYVRAVAGLMCRLAPISSLDSRHAVRVTRREDDASVVPDRLADVETLSADDVTVERQFVFARGGASAHGVTLDSTTAAASSC